MVCKVSRVNVRYTEQNSYERFNRNDWEWSYVQNLNVNGNYFSSKRTSKIQKYIREKIRVDMIQLKSKYNVCKNMFLKATDLEYIVLM